ncbi:hypothetical protein [Actinocrispum wychmicini]|uniref:Lipoprotein n=1 Tax=Actinocrispum wychmicini TaxID=1213861 RepID=A0A4R2JV03_9PSEU|nr:hypothetical protein [Actinocrispum wychmicini]TCO64271.1 hypothetical protein EV192_10136 [Actinocrispum wychmicini]
MKRALVALALFGVVAAGCTPQAPAAAPVGQTSQVPSVGVQWADNLCAAILDYDRDAVTFQMDSTSPATMVSSLRAYLDATTKQLDGAKAKLSGIGPSPVAGGDEATQAIIQSLDVLSQTVRAAQSQIENVNPDDRTAVSTALQQIAQTLQGLRAPVNPLEGMGERFPDLQAAARSADNCTEVSRTRASRSALPPVTSSTPPTSTPPTSSSSTNTPPGSSSESTPPSS